MRSTCVEAGSLPDSLAIRTGRFAAAIVTVETFTRSQLLRRSRATGGLEGRRKLERWPVMLGVGAVGRQASVMSVRSTGPLGIQSAD